MGARSRSKRLFIASVILVAAIVCLCMGLEAAVEMGAFERRQPAPMVSPGGGRMLTTSINRSKEDLTEYLCVRLTITDAATDQTLGVIQTGASDRMRWSVRWLRDDLILLESSDIGNYCWAEMAGKAWVEADCLEPLPDD